MIKTGSTMGGTGTVSKCFYNPSFLITTEPPRLAPLAAKVYSLLRSHKRKPQTITCFLNIFSQVCKHSYRVIF